MIARRSIALALSMGLTASCTPTVTATLDKSVTEAETAAPVSTGDGITVVTADWEAKGHIVDCVSRTMGQSNPRLRVVSAKTLPQSVYRWDALDIADLSRLVQQPAAKEVIAAARVRYVVMVDASTSSLAAGYYSPSSYFSIVSARVWDLVAGDEVAQGNATACGERLFFLETAACEALGRKLAEFFAGTAAAAP